MTIPLTSILDHIVHLTPPRSLHETTKYFQSLGFNVIVGGVHAGGFTENSLIIFPDGAYIELIAFTHPVEHYPEGTPGRTERESQPWAKKLQGWIDYANLGTSPTLSQIINARAEEQGTNVRYLPERPGGRETPDGRVLKWIITALDQGVSNLQGVVLPFFCGDVTPRDWRVPTLDREHPNGALGIAYLRILALETDMSDETRRITTVLASPPLPPSAKGVVWVLHAQKDAEHKPRLILSVPKDDEEHKYVSTRGRGLYEVGFRVDSKEGSIFSSPNYGKVVLVPASAAYVAIS